jgi:hypothetical protein
MLAALLWAFRIEHAVDERTGRRIEIDTEAYEDKLIAGPKPFKVRFTLRSEEHGALIRRQLGEVGELLRMWE